jgi:hypothetical protein
LSSPAAEAVRWNEGLGCVVHVEEIFGFFQYAEAQAFIEAFGGIYFQDLQA